MAVVSLLYSCVQCVKPDSMGILDDGSVCERIAAGQSELDDVFDLLVREGREIRSECEPAPPAAIPMRMSTVSSTVGYPAVTYVMKAGCWTC